jgi:hypothetical protein
MKPWISLCLLSLYLNILLFGVTFSSFSNANPVTCNLSYPESLDFFLRHVPEDERSAMLLREGECRICPLVTEAIKLGNWDALLSNVHAAEDFEPTIRAIFKLVKDGEGKAGQIGLDTLGTALILWSALKDLPTHLEVEKGSHPILVLEADEKSWSEAAEKYLLSTGLLHINHGLGEDFVSRIEENFRKEVVTLPIAEQRFWVLTIPAHPHDFEYPREKPSWTSLLGELMGHSDNHPFHRFVWKDKSALPGQQIKILVPSVGLIRAMLKANFGEKAVMPILQLGKMRWQDLVPGLARGGRTLGLIWPGISNPESADSLRSGHLMFSIHDLYHLVIGSFEQVVHRLALLEVIPILRRLEVYLKPYYDVTHRQSLSKDAPRSNEFHLWMDDHWVAVSNLNMVGMFANRKHISDLDYVTGSFTRKYKGHQYFWQAIRGVFSSSLGMVDGKIASRDGKVFLIIHMAQHSEAYKQFGISIAETLTGLEASRSEREDAFPYTYQELFEAAKHPKSDRLNLSAIEGD